MGKKLLLADDSITIQKVIGITFANEDYDLDIVDNGDAAFDKAKADRPDLILADVYMPGKNGYELCEAVKADASLAGVPVLLLTGTFEPFDEDRARAVGAEDWIAKPFESQALIDKVEGLLARGEQTAPPDVAVPEETTEPEARPVAPESLSEMPLEEETGFESLLETSEDEPFDEPQTWADESEQGPQEPDFGEETDFEEEFEATEEDDDLWGSISLEEESLMDEFAEEEPVGEDLWGTLNEELAVPEPQSEEPPQTGIPVQEETGEEEEDVLPLEETDILEAEELYESEEDDFSFFGDDEEDFDSYGSEPAGESPEPEDFSFEEEEDLFLGEASSEPAAEESLISPAESLTEGEAVFSGSEPEEDVSEEQVQPSPSGSASAQASVEQQVRAISEEDLNRIVEQVAARVLEKIAWEVVPDLAESMIKEEIRKIKEGSE